MQLLPETAIALAAASRETTEIAQLSPEQKILWVAIFIAFVAIFFFIGYILIRRKLEETHADDPMAEMEFERRLLESLDQGSAVGLVQPAPSPPEASLAAEASAVAAPVLVPHSPPPVSPPAHTAPESSADLINPILDRLRSAGLYESSEGTAPLGDGTARAHRVRLRGGRTALILPYLESDYMLSRQLKPYDYLIVRLNNGEVLVARKWGDFIADSMKLG